MTSDALSVITLVFNSIWNLLTSWYIPGTHTTPAAWAMFTLFLSLVVRFISRIFKTSEGTFNEKM